MNHGSPLWSAWRCRDQQVNLYSHFGPTLLTYQKGEDVPEGLGAFQLASAQLLQLPAWQPLSVKLEGRNNTYEVCHVEKKKD